MPTNLRTPNGLGHAGAGLGGAMKRRIRGIGRSGGAFGRDTSGAVIILTAVVFVAVIGFAGLAVDLGGWFATKRSMQTAADAAAVGAAFEMTSPNYTESQVTTAARAAATANGFDPSGGAQVIVTIATGGQSVDVAITEPSPTLFSSLFLGNSVTIGTDAGASLNGAPICILSLEDSAEKGLYLDSNAQIDADGCAIQVNSDSADASWLASNSTVDVTAASICVTGGYRDESTGGYSPTPYVGATECPPLDDPLANVPPPAYDPADCWRTNFELDNEIENLDPGLYCGGLTLKNNSVGTFLPGVYIISGGDLFVDSNSTAQGTGVGFYLTNGAKVHFSSNSFIDFTAPADGPLAGILFFQNRAEGGTHFFDSNNISRLEGTFYFPNGEFESNSNTTIGGGSNFTILIARWIEVNSNAQLIFNSNYAASDVPVPLAIAAQIVRLTR